VRKSHFRQTLSTSIVIVATFNANHASVRVARKHEIELQSNTLAGDALLYLNFRSAAANLFMLKKNKPTNKVGGVLLAGCLVNKTTTHKLKCVAKDELPLILV
jgi:hypothetical protein